MFNILWGNDFDVLFHCCVNWFSNLASWSSSNMYFLWLRIIHSLEWATSNSRKYCNSPRFLSLKYNLKILFRSLINIGHDPIFIKSSTYTIICTCVSPSNLLKWSNYTCSDCIHVAIITLSTWYSIIEIIDSVRIMTYKVCIPLTLCCH